MLRDIIYYCSVAKEQNSCKRTYYIILLLIL